MLEFLPQNVKRGLSHLNIKEVYELRLRADKPVRINYRGKYVCLGEFGITEYGNKAISVSFAEIADCVYKAGKYSVYSVEEQIKQGFLTAANGERIGLSGEYVFEKGKPLAKPRAVNTRAFLFQYNLALFFKLFIIYKIKH